MYLMYALCYRYICIYKTKYIQNYIAIVNNNDNNIKNTTINFRSQRNYTN